MCARYSLITPPAEIANLFEARWKDHEPPVRYNIAPSQNVPVVLQEGAERLIVPMRWGFLPSWARESNKSVVNARSETALEKPFFKSAMKLRRCLMPLDGFYEWRTEADGKQPCLFRRPDGAPFAFAAIWERWSDPERGPVDTVALLTTRPNALASTVHDRMPALFLDRSGWDPWLDPCTPPDQAAALLGPLPEDALRIQLVSRRLNNPRTEGPELWRAPEAVA